jgi:hypothetical protein
MKIYKFILYEAFFCREFAPGSFGQVGPAINLSALVFISVVAANDVHVPFFRHLHSFFTTKGPICQTLLIDRSQAERSTENLMNQFLSNDAS